MNVRIIDLGRVGEETKGNPMLICSEFEVMPKTQRRTIFSDVGA